MVLLTRAVQLIVYINRGKRWQFVCKLWLVWMFILIGTGHGF